MAPVACEPTWFGDGAIRWRRVDGGTQRVPIWRLRDVMGNQAHLVVGSRSALLVDTMAGVGNILDVVRHIVDLPVSVVLTHGHYDHVGGAYFFDSARIAEVEVSGGRIAFEEGLATTAHDALASSGRIDVCTPWSMRDGRRPRFVGVRENDEFDLGGVTVVALAMPGHTAGSMGYLVREARVLLSGDAMTPTMCLFFENSGSVDDWRTTLAKMTSVPFDVFYTGHQDRAFAHESLSDFDACAQFAINDRGTEWVHDLFPQFMGRIHIYRGIDSEADDFLALIERETPETLARAERLRREAKARRAARRAARQGMATPALPIRSFPER